SALAAAGPYWNWSRLREKSRAAIFRSYSARVVPATRQPLSAIRDGHATGLHGRRVTRILPNTFRMPGRGAKAAGAAVRHLLFLTIMERSAAARSPHKQRAIEAVTKSQELCSTTLRITSPAASA